jgi:hypothetical protein
MIRYDCYIDRAESPIPETDPHENAEEDEVFDVYLYSVVEAEERERDSDGESGKGVPYVEECKYGEGEHGYYEEVGGFYSAEGVCG